MSYLLGFLLGIVILRALAGLRRFRSAIFSIARAFSAKDSSKDLSRNRVPQIPVLALTLMFERHAFSYAGFKSTGDEPYGSESHYFARSDCTFCVSISHHVDYGPGDSVSIGESSSQPEGVKFENLLYFADYHPAFNRSRAAGLSHDEALALALDEHIEYSARLLAIIRRNGHLTPHVGDRAEALVIGS